MTTETPEKELAAEKELTHEELFYLNNSKPNYGDVALNLPPDWSRLRMMGDQSFLLTTIGHENGVPDVFKTDNAGDKYQYQWINPRDLSRISTSRSRKYEQVTRSTWSKNPNLWEWDGNGNLIHNGTFLYARPAEAYYADQDALDEATERRDSKRSMSQDEEEALRKIERQGAIVEDDRGRPLKPLSPKQLQRTRDTR